MMWNMILSVVNLNITLFTNIKDTNYFETNSNVYVNVYSLFLVKKKRHQFLDSVSLYIL